MRVQTRAAQRTFWWDRTRPVDADVGPLRAVIFDLDDAVADLDGDGELTPRAGLIDLVMSLFVAGVWVAVVSSGRRTDVEPLVRELLGDGLVETIVTVDDVTGCDPQSDVYELALWELGVAPESALAMVGSVTGEDAASRVGLATVAVATAYTASHDAEQSLVASDCQRLHRRWWSARKRAAAA